MYVMEAHDENDEISDNEDGGIPEEEPVEDQVQDQCITCHLSMQLWLNFKDLKPHYNKIFLGWQYTKFSCHNVVSIPMSLISYGDNKNKLIIIKINY